MKRDGCAEDLGQRDHSLRTRYSSIKYPIVRCCSRLTRSTEPGQFSHGCSHSDKPTHHCVSTLICTTADACFTVDKSSRLGTDLRQWVVVANAVPYRSLLRILLFPLGTPGSPPLVAYAVALDALPILHEELLHLDACPAGLA
ncbi:MAG: hypothetical protein ACI835_003385 [Planctomycetota bacterium]